MTATATEPTAATLLPGDYLLELEMLRPVSRTTIQTALEQAGFSDLVLDPSFASTPRAGSKARIVARLTRPARLAHVSGAIRWRLVHRLSVVPGTWGSLVGREPPAELRLEEGRVYESRLLSRNRSFPSRERVWTGLRMIGHEPLKLVEIKRQMRLPNRPGSLWSEWLSWTRWLGPSTTIVQSPNVLFDETRAL